MKKQIYWQEVLLKEIKYIFIFSVYLIIFFPTILIAKQKWIMDNNLSSITFELPVFLMKNVQGTFENINGYIEIDLENKKNNKAIFSVEIKSIKMNYKKYKPLLMSEIFFDQQLYPITLIDTKKFSYENEKELIINVEITLKDQSQTLPIKIIVKQIAEKIVQLECELFFSRTDFNIGIGEWSNTAILKDKVKINANLFLFKE